MSGVPQFLKHGPACSSACTPFGTRHRAPEAPDRMTVGAAMEWDHVGRSAAPSPVSARFQIAPAKSPATPSAPSPPASSATVIYLAFQRNAPSFKECVQSRQRAAKDESGRLISSSHKKNRAPLMVREGEAAGFLAVDPNDDPFNETLARDGCAEFFRTFPPQRFLRVS